MDDPLFRVWSGPQFEALLIRDAAHHSNLCHQCKDQVTSALTQRLNELVMLASLEGLTLGPTSPALQGARYWQTLPDSNTNAPAAVDTRIMCEKEGRKIAVDGATILWALKQTPGYQEMKNRWAVGDVKHKILFALEGTIEAADMRQAYTSVPHPYGVRDQNGLYATFTQMHWERYQEFTDVTLQLIDADGPYVHYPCQCQDLIRAHQHIHTWYRTWLTNSDFTSAAAVVWALHHVLTNITGPVSPWSPPGSDVGWVCWVHDETQFDGSRPEGVAVVVPMVLAMIKGEGFDLWLMSQAGAVDAEVGLVERMAGHASANARALEAELLQGWICSNMQSLSMVDGDDEEY